MAATVDHDCFIQPEDTSIRLWRYMDFTKFASLVSSSELFLSRADRFTDPFEGSYSRANVALRPHIYKDMDSAAYEAMTVQMAAFSKWIREWTYINCWHANEHESAAMWDLYAKTNEAVAIETSYQKLVDCLPDQAFVGLVNYIDYEKEWLPEGNSFYPFTHKRKSFEHEKEVRIVIQELPNKEKGIFVGVKNSCAGTSVNVNLNNLITRIHVSPTAPDWLVELTKEIANKYGITATISKSNLYSEPVY